MKFFATFGQGHTLHQNFVVVEANDSGQAHAKMFAQYGSIWAFIYTEGVWKEQKQEEIYNLTQVAFGTPNYRRGEEPSSVELPLDNVFGVEIVGIDKVIIHRQTPHPLTRHEAFLLAAWLYQRAKGLPKPHRSVEFGDIMEQVEVIAS